MSSDVKIPGWAEKAAQDFHDKWETRMSGAAFRDLVRALLTAERRGLEKAAEVVCAYPPDEFFEVLHARTHRLPDEDHNWILEGDTGNWAAHMSVLLQPYAAAIRSLGDKS